MRVFGNQERAKPCSMSQTCVARAVQLVWAGDKHRTTSAGTRALQQLSRADGRACSALCAAERARAPKAGAAASRASAARAVSPRGRPDWPPSASELT